MESLNVELISSLKILWVEVNMYQKIDLLHFFSLSKDGRACLLKAICEVSQVGEGKGTFVEEIIKAIFR